MGYRIREWRARYEVTDRGAALRDGDTIRQKPLSFVRLAVHGRALPLGFRKLNRIAGHDAPAVFGVFVKLCEIAADNTAALRGFICDTQGEALSAADIADTLDWPRDVVERALSVLCHSEIGWLEFADGPEGMAATNKAEKIPGNPGIPNIPGEPGDPLLTERNGTKREDISIPPAAVAPVAPCPLSEFGRLEKMYPGIREHLQRAHPRVKLPKVESKQGEAERATLARLIRLDGYTEGEVIHALRWVLKADGEQAEFWRSNFRAIPALRKAKDGATKFTKIFDAMQRDPEWPPVPNDAIRESVEAVGEGVEHDHE